MASPSIINDKPQLPDSIARASLYEIFGALTLANPTISIVRHPFRFDKYKGDPAAAIHYLYAAVGVSMLVMRWTDKADAGNDGGDFAPILRLVNNTLQSIGPNAKLVGDDIIPVGLLVGNIISGLTANFVCRLLSRWFSKPDTAEAAAVSVSSQTYAATAYLGGASAILFSLGQLVSGGDPDAPTMKISGIVILFLFYSWGRWLRQIHRLSLGRVFGCLLPFAVALLSLASFAGATYLVGFAMA